MTIAGLLCLIAALRDWLAPGFVSMKTHDVSQAPYLLVAGLVIIAGDVTGIWSRKKQTPEVGKP